MQLTIDIKNTAIDKVMYLLNNLKSDVKIISTENIPLDIEAIDTNDESYQTVLKLKKEREENPSSFENLDSIKWD